MQKPHSNDPVNAYWSTITPGGNGCSDCHSLQAGQGDTATAYISVNARTLGTIRTVTAGAIPANLGCTFCHDRTTSPAKMKGALAGHFDSQQSQHPVGRTFVGGYTDTQNEYLSSYLSNTTNEMDCLDCHDPAQVAPSGYYMAHNPTDETNNPYMLKANGIAGVTVTAAGRYDAFCRDCHGTSAAANWKSKGKDIRLVSHKDGRDATAAYAIAERDGTLLRTTDVLNDGSADLRTDQCTDCHGMHSTPNAKLFVSAYTNGTDCTSSCHLPGDRYNNYYKHGHGKQTPYATESVSIYEYGGLRMDMAMACTECHTGIDTTTPNSAGTRKPHAEKLAINGDRDNYKANFNLVKNVNIGDPGAPTGNPEWGICISCHSPAEYKAHVSDMDPTATITSCQDCHDEHGEGSGTTSNIFMIPERSKGTGFFKAITRTPPAVEQVRYLTPYFNTARTAPSGGPYDFYRADGMGSCDNMECHGTTWTANNPGPLSVLMGTGPADTHHSNGYQAPGADCNQCHTHKDTAGGWRAVAACDDCHNAAGFPNPTGIARTHTDPSESEAIHDLHANSTQIVGGCTACHSHDGKTSSADHMNGTVNFGGTKLAATQNYSVSAFPDSGCTAANGCHDAEAGEWASANRLGALQTGCVNCHNPGTSGVIDKDLDQGGWPVPTKAGADKHTLHNASTYVPGDGVQTYHCTDCHGANADLGNHAGHVNGSNTVANSGTNVDVTAYQSADKTCTNSCHVVGLGVVAKRWTTGVLVCVDCHAGGTYIGDGANGAVSGLHATTEANMTSLVRHDDLFKATRNEVSPSANCITCHTATPSTAHLNGVFTNSWNAAPPSINFAATVGFTDGATTPGCSPNGALLTCHDDRGAWKRWWSATADDNTADECDNCHGMFKGSVGTGDNTWVTGISLRHGDTDANGGLEANHTGSPAGGPCFQCHTADTVGSQTFYTFATQHRDGSIQLNNQNQLNDNGATIGCLGCHAVTGLTSDGIDSIVMADTMTGDGLGADRWGRVLQLGPIGDCDSCHDSILLTASGFPAHGNLPNENDTLHTAHQSGPYISGCAVCHTNSGSGADHNNGTVNFKAAASGGMLDSTLNYLRTATFANTNCSTVNLCHNSDAGEWGAGNLGTDVCVDCHSSGTKLLGNGKAATSGLHVVSATNVTAHNETLAAGNCVNCHATLATAPASHINNVWQADAASNTESRFITRAGMTYTEATPNSATCSAPSPATGLDGCHSDGGEWSRLWSTEADLDYKALNANRDPGNAVCNVCHGQYATLNAKGWRPGTSHYTSSDLADKTQENKGVIHTDTPNSAACEDCHAYYGTAGHENGSITFSDGAPTGYTLMLNTTPNPDTRHCSTCHDSQSAEAASATASHVFYDSTAFPGANGVNHVDGVSEPTGCSGCHGNSANDTMWPYLTATTDVTAYPNRDGNHVKHVTVIMTRLNDTDGWATNPTGTRTMAAAGMTQDDALEICAFCHADSVPNFGHGTHYVSTWSTNKLAAQPADVTNEPGWTTIKFKPIWNKAGSDADGDFVATTYTGNVVTAATSGCNTIDCHNSKNTTTTAGIDFRWYGANTSACIMCHADVTSGSVATGVTHNAHINAAGSGGFGGTAMTCPTCHTGTVATSWSGNIAPAGPPTGGHINGATLIAGSANFTYAASSCGTNLCHTRGWSLAGALQAPYNVNGAASYTWGTGALADCTLCHGDAASLAAAWTATNTAHFTHLTRSAVFGRTIACGDCHTAANTATHMNGSVTIGGSVTLTYPAAATSITANPNTFSACGTNACHSDGTVASPGPYTAVQNPSWDAGLLADCTICHQNATTMISAGHAKHLNNGYTSAPCTDCHAAETLTTHINGSTNFDAAKATYSLTAAPANGPAANGTCTTVACHNRGVTVSGAAASAAWNVGGNGLACDACHYYRLPATSATNTGWSLVSNTSHNKHFDQGKLCADCHGVLPINAAHIGGKATLTSGAIATYTQNAVGEAGLSMAAYSTYDTTLHTCSAPTNYGLGCHASGTPDWDLVNNTLPLACIACHSNTTTTQVNPTTGVHGASRIAANPHDDFWKNDKLAADGTALCTTCHNLALTTEHATGVLTEASADLTLAAGTLGFTPGAPPSCSPNGALLTCHDDGGVWKRLWDSTASLNTGAECMNCHGGVTAGYGGGGWVTGISQRHSDPQITPNHAVCDYCHEYNNGSITPYNLGTMHRDGSIQLNATVVADLGYVENGTAPNKRIGCSNCHSAADYASYANGEHEFDMLTDGTRWARANLDGAAYDCNNCHTTNGANHTSTNESLARHDLHTNSIYSMACTDCHANPGAGGHNDGSVRLDGSRITVAESYTGNLFDGTCTNSCHTYTGNWATGTNACADCHASGRVGGALLGAHTAHGIGAFTAATLCGNCHGASAYTKTLGGNHGNSATNFSGVTYTGARNVLTGTCTTTDCHNISLLADPSTAWNTTALACNDCHYWVAGDPTSAANVGANWALGGSHNAHFDATGVSACIECHADNSTDTTQPLTHINTGVYTTAAGLIDRARATGLEASLTAAAMGTKIRAVAANTQTCDNALCHNPSNDLHVSNAWNTANPGCAMCHVDPATANSTPGTGSHTQHRQASVATTFGKTVTCNDCHVDQTGLYTHMNKAHDIRVQRDGVFVAVTTQLSAGPGTIAVPAGCGINDCHNNGQGRAVTAGLPNSYTWGTNTVPDKCNVCHNNATTMVSYGHAKHLNNGYTSAPCTDCHTAATVATHLNASVNFQNLTNIAGTLGVTNLVAVGTGAGTTPFTGTCATVSCHNRGTTIAGLTMSAAWNVGGNGLACDACHYYRLPATSATNTGWSLVSNISHNKHFDAGKLCADCHGALPINAAHIGGKATLTSGAIATYTANVIGEAGVTMPAYTTYDTTLHTCSAPTSNGLGCHATGTPDWDVSFASTVCLNCHTNETTAAVNPTSGLHNFSVATRHDDTLLTGNCINCHSNTATRTAVSALHQNGALDNANTVGANFGWNANVTGYNRTADTCTAAIACHTDGGTWNRKWTNAVNAVPAITDDAATATVCRNCHGSFFTGWNIVVPTDHVNPDVDNDAGATPNLASSKASHSECTKCHGWGVGAYTAAMHNGAVHQLQMNSDLTYQDAGGTVGQCTTNCHAGLTLSMDTNSGWTTVSAAFGGLGCGDCHNGGTRPGAANNSGAHDIHGADDAALVAPGTACQPCHGDNGGSGFLSTSAGTHGIGNAVNWATNMVYSTAVRNNVTGTCSGTAACHVSSGTNIQWGQTQVGTNDCRVCHQGTADINDYIWTGTALGTPSAVNNTEYTLVGHGSANGNSTGCMACHDITQPHDKTAGLTGGNPFRLKNLAGTGPNNFTCTSAACHPTATATNEVALGLTYGAIQNHERANFPAPQVVAWSFTPKCVDCHDPHGDTTNVKMMHNDLWDNGSGANYVPAGYASIGNNNVVFTNYTTGQNATGEAYADSDTPWSSLCQECHETAEAAMASYLDNSNLQTPGTGTANSTGHPASPADCSGCHKHDSGFKPSGCDGCHGNGSGQNWPDGTPGVPAYADNSAGAHVKHINAIAGARSWTTDAEKNGTCDWCHANPGSPRQGTYTGSPEGSHDSDSMTDSRVDVIGDGRVTAGDATFFDNGNPRASDADGSYNPATKSCLAIDCHAGQQTPNWDTGQLVDSVAPYWNTAPNERVSGITVQDMATDMDILVSWDTATDDMTPPVKYDLYRKTTSFAGNPLSGTLVTGAGDLLTNSFLDTTVPANNTTYYYAVVAKDSNGTPNTRNASDEASGQATAAGGGGSAYRMIKSNGATIYGAITTSISSACSSTETASAMTTSPPPPERGLLTTGSYTCASTSANNHLRFTGQTTAYKYAAGFYSGTAETAATRYTGTTASTSNNNIRVKGSAGTEILRVYLASVDASGVQTLSATYGQVTATSATSVTAGTAKTMDLSAVNVTVPAGSKLAVIYQWGNDSTATTNDQIGVDATASNSNMITLTSALIDTTAPDWTTTTVSGIAVTDLHTTNDLQITWSAATESGAATSPPVKYDLYRKATTFGGVPTSGTLIASNLTGTSYTDANVTVQTWYYALVVKDSAATPNTRNASDQASGAPTPPDSCTICHGMAPATGAHTAHAPTGAKTSCDNCHGSASYSVSTLVGGGYTNSGPAGLHNNGSADVYLVRANAGDNDNGTYTPATGICTNVDCHQNNPSPSWIGLISQTDTTAPTWGTPGVAAVATNYNAATVSWNVTATDASLPITYTVYWASSAANVFSVPAGTMPGLSTSPAVVTNLTATAWYFGVRAYDAATPVANFIASATVGPVTPSNAPAGSGTVYRMIKDNGNTIYGAITTSITTTCSTFGAAGVMTTAPPPPSRGLLTTGSQLCGTASTNNRLRFTGQSTAYRYAAGFYLPTVETGDAQYAGAAAGNSIHVRGSAGTEILRVYLASVDAAGAQTLSSTYAQVTSTTTFTAKAPNLSALNVTVPAGSKLAVIYQWAETGAATATTADIIGVDNNAAGSNQVTLVANYAPAWSGGSSGISASPAPASLAIDVSWSSATDSNTPVSYLLYRQTGSSSTIWTVPDSGWPKTFSVTSMRDISLTNGTTYFYGVRAQDSTMPTSLKTANTDTSSATASTFYCNVCHQFPPTTGVNHSANLTAPLDTNGFLKAHDSCLACHGKNADGSLPAYGSSHADGSLQLNSSVGYNVSTFGCATACHANDANHNMTGSTTYPNPVLVAMGKDGVALSGSCRNCHGSGSYGATAIGSAIHADPDGSGSAWGPGDCMGCHAGHIGAPGAVVIPQPSTTWDPDGTGTLTANANLPTLLGITTSTHGAGAISLGGNGTRSQISAKTTESEICWGCHDSVSVSEWGVNTDTNGAASNYNHGTVSTSTWTTATWTSAQTASPSFAYKTLAIGSTHAANPGTGVQGNDAVGNLRCSYCHDVHDTKGPAGKPYLRGAWMGSPYKQDGAPQPTSTFTSYVPNASTGNVAWGAVPRASANTAQGLGGYWIDQNSGSPASTWTPAQFGGLCELCHANGDGTFAAAEIDALNTFGSGTTEWVSGANGHANSVKGSSGATTPAGRNIFNTRGGGTAGGTTPPLMHFWGVTDPADAGGSDQAFRGAGSGLGYQPQMAGCPENYDATDWGANGTVAGGTEIDYTGASVNSLYHNFPCSKCHNPHASRLPRLMITNCLDTKHNNWDNDYQVSAVGTTAANLNRSISNWTTAQNCHRLVGDDTSDTRDATTVSTTNGGGWNKVTPW